LKTVNILFRCEHGILTSWYASSELKPYEGIPSFQFISDPNVVTNTISLREAAKSSRREIICHCLKTCASKKCPCKRAGVRCSSHCHQGNLSCINCEMVKEEIDVQAISSESMYVSMKICMHVLLVFIYILKSVFCNNDLTVLVMCDT